MKLKQRLTGLIAATHTPMHSDGSVNLHRIGQLTERLIGDGVSGLYVCGSTGEGVSMSNAERMAVAEAFIKSASNRVPVIVQVGCNSLPDAAELAAHARKAGASAISATPPSYFKPNSVSTLATCMGLIAAAAPDLPFYYYHIPTMTGVAVDMPEFLRHAATVIPTLAGIKFTSFAIHEFQACVDLDGGKFDCLYGHDEMLLESMSIGARGAVGSTYTFAAPLYRRIIAAFDKGDLKEARRLQGLSVAFIRIVVKFRGLAGIKAAMKICGFDCGPVRLPLQTLSDAEMQAMEQELSAIGFFQWVR